MELFGFTPSHLKQTLLNCIQEQGELNGHNLNHLNKLLPSILDNAPRRNLASTPSPSPPPKRSSRRPPPPPPASKKSVSEKLASKPASSAKGKEDHQKTIIIAVVTTAVSTFLLAACLFLCCTKVCGKGSGRRINDERPLLSLSSNEYSLGSSNNYGGSGKGHQSFNGNNSDNFVTLEERMSQDGMFSTISNSHGIPPLKAPPGRKSSKISWKPPSGKVEPLPPEPPKFLKVSSSKKSSPSPPPPPMPSSAGPPAPPPGSGGPKPPPPPGPKGPRPPPPMSRGPKAPPASSGPASSGDDDAPKTKLKPFFWDKVQANPEQSMVWNDIRSGSFQ